MTVAEINAMTRSEFVAHFGFLFEHSSWVVEAAADHRPFADLAAMETAMNRVVEEAGGERRLELLRAHPELAGKAAIDRTLTEASAAEQASAGLDRLTPEEYARFHALNDAYRERFGFPFIVCVRLTDKAGVLAQMSERLANSREAEIATALSEVSKIVHLRLMEALA